MAVVQLTPAGGGWGDSDIATTANVTATKLQHRQVITDELYGPTTAVAALTKWVAMLTGVGGQQIVDVEAAIAVQATGADRTITVDLQRSTGGGAFATVLSSTIGFTDSTAVRTVQSGVISASTIAEGDILEIIVTVAGSADAQATGLTVAVTLDTKKPS